MIEHLPPILFLLLIYGGAICAVIYILRLFGRLVSALESIARKMRDDSKL